MTAPTPAPGDWRQWAANAVAEIDAAGLRRRRRNVESTGPAQQVSVDGRAAINFCGNDYLGLAQHARLTAAFAQAAAAGAGSGASHLVTGHHPLHHALEQRLAAWTGRERALAFSSGYLANLGVVCALAGRGDAVLEDRLNHASLIDAGLLSGARFARYAHADAAALAAKLSATPARRSIVVTDGVFSMDGDLAPLPALAAASRNAGALLIVDDAHGYGVLGATGRGTLEHFGLDEAAVPLAIGTLGKAFGSYGAFVTGPAELVELVLQRARSYRYTTALPPAVAAATIAALDVLDAEPWRRARVLDLVARFRQRAATAGLVLAGSPTPIQPILLGTPDAALAASEALLARGFMVAAIRPPTVPAGTSRLRVTLSASHEDRDVDALVDALAEVLALPVRDAG
ncbi:MAG: 8-amino-7-oxononanoate synthase [Gammaproteobacteria bacterium]|nr:8-amino-7-oxononanoate synthase [Gammaproteobacteria bacterium]